MRNLARVDPTCHLSLANSNCHFKWHRVLCLASAFSETPEMSSPAPSLALGCRRNSGRHCHCIIIIILEWQCSSQPSLPSCLSLPCFVYRLSPAFECGVGVWHILLWWNNRWGEKCIHSGRCKLGLFTSTHGEAISRAKVKCISFTPVRLQSTPNFSWLHI